MPVEINELVIRVVVDQPARRPAASAGTETGAAREELVQQCVDAVLAALRDKQER